MANIFEIIRKLFRRKSVSICTVLAVVIAIGLVLTHNWQQGQRTEITYSEFSRTLAAGDVKDIQVESEGIAVHAKDGTRAFVRVPAGLVDTDFLDKVSASGARINFAQADFNLLGIASTLVPLALLAVVLLVVAVQADLKLGESWPRVVKQVPNRFSDVAGQDEPKAELAEIIAFLRNPEVFARVGARAPRGVLMVGPPGTGKTLIAKALAGEAGVSFLAVSGSEFSAPLMGVAKSRVAKLFREARRRAPCLVFIDEIDAIGRKRNDGAAAADRESDTTLNQLLVEMDGFNTAEGVILIGATNRVDVLDRALLRPGRFDRQVHIGLPDMAGREAIMHVHAKRIPLSDGVELKNIARATAGFSGADLGNLINEAAIFAAREGADVVTTEHLDAARNKILMGLERRSLVLDPEERHLVAVHEAGHALCACLTEGSDKVHTATIVPHGRALGLVMRLPERDRLCIPLEKLEADLIVAMGGRAAEEVVFGRRKITNGAASDIEHATNIARYMVTEWGMSETIGLVRIARPDGTLSTEAEAEIRRIVEDMYAAAKACIVANRDSLEALAAALLQHETIDGDEVRRIVAAGAHRMAA